MKFIVEGKLANINSKYSIQTEDIIFFENEMEIISDNKAIIKDKNNIYEIKFKILC